MPKTRINCPNCRQPITADVNQLFDAGQDPRAKQLILSGMINLVQCPHCGYQGNLATPIVYHDPDKELLMTYFPPELGLPVQEQERLVGPMLKQVMDNLPVEKRKGYLLRPQTMFTLQSLVERVLEGEGITKEMIEAQQKRLALMQRMLAVTSDDVLDQMVKENDALLDADFFNLFNRLMSAAMQARDENAAKQLNALQSKLLPMTTFGKEVQAQSQEVEAAMQSLQALGKNLTRESLLDLLIQAPNETRLSMLVSLARQAMDYNFFQILTDRIDKAQGDERLKLLDLRTNLLAMTQRIDKELEARANRSLQLLNEILKASDIAEATRQNLAGIDDFFVSSLNEQMEAARKNGDLDQIGKLNQVLGVLQQASEPPHELALIEELLDAADENAMQQALEAHKQDISPEFLETLGAVMAQMENSEEKEVAERLQMLYRLAVRMSMQNSMKQ